MKKIRGCSLAITAILLIFGIASCGGKKPASQIEGPTWWQVLSLQEREYFAELYRVSIAIAVMEEAQLHFIQQWRMRQSEKVAGYDTTAWRTVLEYRRIASDRARLALRLADGESAKWLKQFLALYLESDPIQITNPERFLRELDSLANISIDPIPTRYRIQFEPGRIVAVTLSTS
ncbi:MAG: hypothetical protein OEM52_14185, partial [bacterium]|nr:hypothetical protein [bacterium]